MPSILEPEKVTACLRWWVLYERASGRKVPYRVTSRRSGDVAECYANPEKAGELLKWGTRVICKR